jgi:hypothetical protein
MPSIRDAKDPSADSIFRPSALLREARRQKSLAAVDVPAVCILAGRAPLCPPSLRA